MGERRPVTVDPARRFGRPCIGLLDTDSVAGMVRAGETVDTVADEYDLTPDEVLVACWFEGRFGSKRRVWGRWAKEAEVALGGHAPMAGLGPPPARQR